MQVDFLLETYEGREFLFDLLQECGVFKQGDVTNLDFSEGTRYIGLQILDKIFTKDVNYFTLMYNEHNDRIKDAPNTTS